jgi:glycosyltransferase involved in cell wall biosynthesis
MEVIFVDDGSEDGTLQIILNYVSKMDIKAKVFQSKWQGLGAARNLIVDNAQGDYIVWVDSDEILSKEYVRKQVEFMEQNPNVGICGGMVKIISSNLILNLELIPRIVDNVSFGKPRSFIWKTERLPGTGGSIFRVKAIRQVKGFNEQISGVGEDQDIALRIKKANWLIRFNDAKFYETHGEMATLKDLWKKYLWYGYGSHKLYRKNTQLFIFPRMSPIAGFIAGFFYSLIAYKLLNQKMVFLLPLHFGFKMIAWTLGFIKSQIGFTLDN